jgi:PilZ domain-containing protein
LVSDERQLTAGRIMSEKRAVARRRILKAGKIEFTGSAIDWTVRNLSKLGAALNVASPVGIPDEFVFAIPGDGLRAACRVVWRKPDQIGIRFRLGTRALVNQAALKKGDRSLI